MFLGVFFIHHYSAGGHRTHLPKRQNQTFASGLCLRLAPKEVSRFRLDRTVGGVEWESKVLSGREMGEGRRRGGMGKRPNGYKGGGRPRGGER